MDDVDVSICFHRGVQTFQFICGTFASHRQSSAQARDSAQCVQTNDSLAACTNGCDSKLSMKKKRPSFYHTHISLSLVAAISAAAILLDSAQVRFVNHAN